MEDNMQTEKSFTARVTDFWDWFLQNEKQIADAIADGVPDDPEAFFAFLHEGGGLIYKDISFNVGGNNEFTFAVDGNDAMHFLLPYVVEQMPESLSGKWHFYAGMRGTGGRDFGMQMFGVKANAEEVSVSVSIQEDSSRADLRFFCKKLKSLDDHHAYGFFFILMDNIVGERLVYTCVGDVNRARKKESGMIPLTELEAKLRAEIWTENGEPNPAQQFFLYEFDMHDNFPRADIFVGRSCYAGIINAFLNKDDEVFDSFADCGAKALYLYYEPDPERANPLEERNAIEDALFENALNDESKDRMGIVLGAAMGQQYAYIDLLVYDLEAFLTQLTPILAHYPDVEFFLAEFKSGGAVTAL
jgi:hypothetical protein